MRVQRIVYAAKPAKSHPERHEWETAQVVIFLAAGDEPNGLAKAQEFLRRQHWEPVRLLMHSPLSEERARNEGAEIWEAYEAAQSGRVFFRGKCCEVESRDAKYPGAEIIRQRLQLQTDLQ
jgi:hypothetical protein